MTAQPPETIAALRERIDARLRQHAAYCEHNKPRCDCPDIVLFRAAAAEIVIRVGPRTPDTTGRGEEMKALTVCQPYAELIARGEKPIENRTWPTTYRGPLLIHAGKSRAWMDDEDDTRYPEMVFGAVVAVTRLAMCLKFDDVAPWPNRWAHLRRHEHANGPWCWVLEDVRRVPQPILYRGAQGLWDVPSDLGALVEKALSVSAVATPVE